MDRKATGVMPDPPQITPDAEMNVLLIAYELVESAAGENRLEAHEGFLRVLDTYPVRAQLTSFAWLVKTPRSAVDVLEALDRHLMPADRLFVAAMSGEAAWRNIEQGFDWLEETLGSCGRPAGMARKAT
jgi:hypothetical protein